MYCCIECGRVFSEQQASVWSESRGEYWGTQCYEEVSGCPYCRGSYVETYECAECGEWITGEYIKLNDGRRICEGCYTAYSLGEE